MRLIACALPILILFSSCSKNLTYATVKTESRCIEKDGYWYNSECWKEFEDDGISIADIDSTVTAQMKIIEKSKLILDDVSFPLLSFFPVEEKEGMILIAVYKEDDANKTFIFPTGKKMKSLKGSFDCPALLFDGDAMGGEIDLESVRNGTVTVSIHNIDQLNIEFKGTFSDPDSSLHHFSFTSNEEILGAGNSHFDIRGDEVFLSGDLGTITYYQLKDLIKNHPNVKTIVMTHISGSLNDAINMHTGRLVRENGFTTKVLSDSDIASGGVDLFCAGEKRIIEKGAKIGVHSWCCVNDLTAIEIPKTHPAHKYQLEYFTMALGNKIGPEFYFYTLEASPFDDVHYMSLEEIKQWGLATKLIEE